MRDDLDPSTFDQLMMDRADSIYEELCWKADRDELLGLTVDRPTLAEFLEQDRKYRPEVTP
jgi:hypothetical protein